MELRIIMLLNFPEFLNTSCIAEKNITLVKQSDLNNDNDPSKIHRFDIEELKRRIQSLRDDEDSVISNKEEFIVSTHNTLASSHKRETSKNQNPKTLILNLYQKDKRGIFSRKGSFEPCFDNQGNNKFSSTDRINNPSNSFNSNNDAMITFVNTVSPILNEISPKSKFHDNKEKEIYIRMYGANTLIVIIELRYSIITPDMYKQENSPEDIEMSKLILRENKERLEISQSMFENEKDTDCNNQIKSDGQENSKFSRLIRYNKTNQSLNHKADDFGEFETSLKSKIKLEGDYKDHISINNVPDTHLKNEKLEEIKKAVEELENIICSLSEYLYEQTETVDKKETRMDFEKIKNSEDTIFYKGKNESDQLNTVSPVIPKKSLKLGARKIVYSNSADMIDWSDFSNRQNAEIKNGNLLKLLVNDELSCQSMIKTRENEKSGEKTLNTNQTPISIYKGTERDMEKFSEEMSKGLILSKDNGNRDNDDFVQAENKKFLNPVIHMGSNSNLMSIHNPDGLPLHQYENLTRFDQKEYNMNKNISNETKKLFYNPEYTRLKNKELLYDVPRSHSGCKCMSLIRGNINNTIERDLHAEDNGLVKVQYNNEIKKDYLRIGGLYTADMNLHRKNRIECVFSVDENLLIKDLCTSNNSSIKKSIPENNNENDDKIEEEIAKNFHNQEKEKSIISNIQNSGDCDEKMNINWNPSNEEYIKRKEKNNGSDTKKKEGMGFNKKNFSDKTTISGCFGFDKLFKSKKYDSGNYYYKKDLTIDNFSKSSSSESINHDVIFKPVWSKNEKYDILLEKALRKFIIDSGVKTSEGANKMIMKIKDLIFNSEPGKIVYIEVEMS